jgi:2-dehydrotetronate isomerase
MSGFSANLGFLWRDLPLPAAIAAAKRAGFSAVEVHWPYATPAAQTARALAQAGLPLIALNTAPGPAGHFGLSALPKQSAAARAAIAQAVAYARATGAGAVHVMAGIADGPAATSAYHSALEHACDSAPDLDVLIEPINSIDVPGYFLNHPERALETLTALGRPNLKIMADCYHLARIDGGAQVLAWLRRLRPWLGHVQFARVPDRGPPDARPVMAPAGTAPDLPTILATLAELGWTRPPGAEYRPPGATEDSLGWMHHSA